MSTSMLEPTVAATPIATQPRVMVVAPGPLFSTFDVWEAAVSGLRAAGAEVLPVAYHDDLRLVGAIEDRVQGDANQAFHSLTVYASHRTMALAMAWRPEAVVCISGTVFPPPVAALLGQYTRTAVVLTESPYQIDQELAIQSCYRTAFTNERRMVPRIIEQRYQDGHSHPESVYYLQHMFDPARHYPREPEPEYASDVCFIGSPFPERQALLNGVNWSGIDVRAFGVFDDLAAVEQRDDHEPLTVKANTEAHRWYAGAKIVINHHRTIRYYGREQQIDAGEAESLNPRVYELAAARVFQVCDDSRPELATMFGDSIPTYRADDSADLERVIRYYLAHPRERERLAAEAYRRVQAHSAENRMRFVLDRIVRKDDTCR